MEAGISKTVRVIIADDHPYVRKGIRKVLELSPQVDVIGEATNGRQALELVEELEPDLLLLDVDMPVLSGIEVARLLHIKKPLLKFLILSAYDDLFFIQETLKAGASGYLTKDEVPIYLLEAVLGVADGGKYWLSGQVRRRLEAAG